MDRVYKLIQSIRVHTDNIGHKLCRRPGCLYPGQVPGSVHLYVVVDNHTDHTSLVSLLPYVLYALMNQVSPTAD